jgi:CHASE2 domain-containing sensor protein/predicted Ser/Thr protein kinase
MAQDPVVPGGVGDGSTLRDPRRSLLGEDFGPYHLLEKLGEGGFGVVYLAERREPMVQRVALKVLKPGVESPDLVRRFNQECQALALLDHPNIARVYDAGVNPAGRPYFAMEYIPGETLREYVQRRGPTLEQRLRVFLAITHAVGHAHTHGLVHRDLKPANILVREQDGTATPKIIDFGVAKALYLGQSRVHTMRGETIGTPEYMSPEQAGSSSGEVDARADIYSLGVLLFELLTGEMPWDVTRLRSASPAALPELIERTAARRAGEVNPKLRGDIETVIAKAMHKDRSRRYTTAPELAEDIERLLAGQSVLARRDSLAYMMGSRVRQTARKSPLTVYVTACIAAVAIVHFLLVPLLLTELRVGHAYERLLAASRPVLAPEAPLRHAAVVALTDEHSPTALARIAGVEGVSDEVLTSERLVHAAMLRKLAAAGPACVVIDVNFRRGAHVEELREALAALDGAGVPWVAKLPEWVLDDRVESDLSPAFLADPRQRYGGATVGTGDRLCHFVLCARRGAGSLRPGLPLHVVAAVRRPNMRFDMTLTEERGKLGLDYWDQDANGVKRYAGAPDEVPVSFVGPATASGNGILEKDEVTHFTFHVPGTRVLESATRSYAQVLGADDSQVRAWYAGKVVVLGSLRASGKDVVEWPDGRWNWGPHLVAAGIEALLVERLARVPESTTQVLLLGCAAVAGVLIGSLCAGRWRWRMGVLVGLSMGLLLVSVAGYAWMGVLFNPTPCVLAMVVASELTAWPMAAAGRARLKAA